MSELFKKELENKVSQVLTEDKVKLVKEAAEKYFTVNNTVNGKEFFEKIILDAAKDYPTTSMKFYQAVTELKSRLGRLFDDSIALQKLEIEKEMLLLDIEELESKKSLFGKLDRRTQLEIKLKEQEVLSKSVRIGSSKDSLIALTQEVEDFKALCDQYVATGEVKPYDIARLEEMEKKKKMLYLNHVLEGRPFTNPELAFFLQEDGTVRPPEGIEDDLLRLGQIDQALLIENRRNTVDSAKKSRESGEKLPDLSEIKKQLQHQKRDNDDVRIVRK